MHLGTRFARFSPSLQSAEPLTDDQIRAVAPSIFGDNKHDSRSERYSYIPTSSVLDELRKEGFQPFMVCQTRVRNEDRREFTKHMIRLRHAGQIEAREANEIIVINSHDGTSSYQLMAGMYRFVCKNGLVCGNTVADLRIPHKGDIVSEVVQGAYDVLDGFDLVREVKEGLQGVTLDAGEQQAFARAALALRYEEREDGTASAPITDTQLLTPRRTEDVASDLWSTFNRAQENMIRGGLRGRNATGRRVSTRPVQGIDQSIKLNRALWVLAEEMRKLKN
ncbi:protein YafZ [Cupriavidus basilensis OR16]|uniref:Protein YafZ n=1 Tax=Cupriavidus basilensis OR16 TaxID=1127483 RepID=H1RZZ6_9BURK|nr:DUF932 domain-containing protein [Cupriavidus basilensis]EHP44212.1 protein YafZ [Cupriavidus basilensis OR16]